ncbi:MAG TPA: thrombospondin type 3 repeat-containing protein [Ramlibacter sp.]|nr:thrombospondin type 3 repeat-containing protein [Ramlibacter sp.]
MRHKTLLAAALAAGSLMGLAPLAQAAPAVVAGTTPGTSGYQYPGTTVYQYPGTTVYQQPGSATYVYPGTYPGQYGMPAPPPAPLNSEDPGLRDGYVWAPGQWLVVNGKYMWQNGQWLPARPGYAWQAPQWQQRSDGLWYMVGGNWVRTDNYAYGGRVDFGPYGDMDHDGIRNADDQDRDGDGVANWRDNFPNDPTRR